MINERALLERARLESQRIVDQGRADAQYRVDEADRYTIGALRNLREELRALIHQVDSGLAMMEGQVVDPSAGRRRSQGSGRGADAEPPREEPTPAAEEAD